MPSRYERDLELSTCIFAFDWPAFGKQALYVEATHVVFRFLQVKTTQPRRYLVRPNQGIIHPGRSEVVQILLVEKDKTVLLQSYATMGESALEQCRDKFLVQSIAVENTENLENYEELTSFWTQMTSSKNPGIANKKLQVRLKVDSVAASPAPRNQLPVESMNQSEMAAELTSLRSKYDELVSFSVNLTAERDMLNNTLEQTKRDLQLAGNGPAKPALKKTNKSSSSGVAVALLAVILGIVVGAKLHQLGLLRHVPILGDQLYDEL